MRVVADTNVLISGLLFGGVPGQVLMAWSAGALRLVVSPPVPEEYRRVGLELSKGREPLVGLVESFVAMVTTHALIVDARPLEVGVSVDPDDDMFLATAIAGNAPIIVSGDKHLLQVTGWSGIEVLKPRQFVDRFLGGGEPRR